MDLLSRKHGLIQFLVSGISEERFTNGLFGIQLGFRSYNDFVNRQKQTINQANEAMIITLEFIRNQIVPQARVIDRPTMNTYDIAGFVFDVDNKIVFYDFRQ